MTTSLKDDVVGLVVEAGGNGELAGNIVDDLLSDGAIVRDLMDKAGSEAKENCETRKRELWEERSRLYETLAPQDGLFVRLRQISQELLQLERGFDDVLQQSRGDDGDSSESELQQKLSSVDSKLRALQEMMGPQTKIPWRLKYVTDVDPLSDTGVVRLGGSAIVDSQGRNCWADYCGTCDLELLGSVERWRCFCCSEQSVQCAECHEVWNAHAGCCSAENMVVRETQHAVFRRLDITSPSGRSSLSYSLRATLANMFRTWSSRPCFCVIRGKQSVHPDGNKQKGKNQTAESWLTYAEVFDRVRRMATLIVTALEQHSDSPKLMLCFPAGSMDFYLADMACVLAGITTVGIPPTLAKTGRMPSIRHVICDKRLLATMAFPPETTIVIDIDQFGDYEPLEVDMTVRDRDESLYTIFYTSGSTGTPKEIPITRQVFLKEDVLCADHCSVPDCFLSYLPACWATDRIMVYGALYNGARVAFTNRHGQPTLPEIVQDLEVVEPSTFIAPPALLQFICSLEPPPNLGRRLRGIGCGGAPVSVSLRRYISETYGVPCIEAYGITECGSIASNGRVLPRMVESLRVRDTVTGEWLSLDDSSSDAVAVGELWVGDFNTQDIVELSDCGTRIRVLGRSEQAVSFKTDGGKWISLMEIEDEIIRESSSDGLLQSAMVVRNNSKALLVLIVVVEPEKEKQVDKEDLLQQIRTRVTVSPEWFPRSIIITHEAFPTTHNHKIQRSAVLDKFRDEIESAFPMNFASDNSFSSSLDKRDASVRLAERILGHDVDPKLSFLENGGDSLSAVRWLADMKFHCGGNDGFAVAPDWRSLLTEPLSRGTCPSQEVMSEEDGEPRMVESTDVTPSTCSRLLSNTDMSEDASYILLTGATGFLGKHVLPELLQRDEDTIIICLVRAESRHTWKESRRVVAVTDVPTRLRYHQVIHLAAKVNHIQGYEQLKASNVDLTEQLLQLPRLDPRKMLYCSTSSTRDGKPPFRDGYTQSKWVSEQMVLNAGGSCVWPPFLVWGNKKDWLMRLIQHCLDTGTCPSQEALGFLPCAPVELCAKEIVSNGRTCRIWDLDLNELFMRIRLEQSGFALRSVSLANFCAAAARDRECAAYPILPLLQQGATGSHPSRMMIGSERNPTLDLFPLDAQHVCKLLETHLV